MQRTAVAETHAAIAGGEARRRGPTHSCVLCIGAGSVKSIAGEADPAGAHECRYFECSTRITS